MKLRQQRRIIGLGLWFFAPLIGFFSLLLGPGEVSFGELLEILYHKLRQLWDPSDSIARRDSLEALVWQVRLPRSLLALFIGGALGCSGAITQGVFRNPLASPNILGLGSAAAMMVVLGISLGIDELWLWSKPLLAAGGVLLSLFLLYLFSRWSEGILSLLLSGLALSTLFGALMTALLGIHLNNYEASLKMSQWLLGSFEARSWPHLFLAVFPITVGLLLALYLRKDLDVLYLDPQSAASLGLNLQVTYLVSILSVALLLGTAVSLVGLIGFVGLIVPHIARILVGPGHGGLIPFCIAFGACLLLVVDIVSRVFVFVYLPPGVITSLLGAPLFLWLIHKSRL